MNRTVTAALAAAILFSTAGPVLAQDKPKGPPPAKVTTAEASSAIMAPSAEFVGTVYYQEVSEVATELGGIVEVFQFEEGRRVKEGEVLVTLRSDLLNKRLEATRASHRQVKFDLEKKRLDLKRVLRLYKENSIAEQRYDEERFGVKGLEQSAASLRAQVEYLQLEIKKKIIRAPFGGVVVKRHVGRGEWLAAGATVATLAKDDVIDIVVEVPEQVIKHVKTGTPVNITANGGDFSGEVFAVVPRGDISTRTFPVKIRSPNRLSLIEGMAARVRLPTGPRENALVVPRDAVIPMFGKSVLFTVVDSKARMIPVEVTGYDGLMIAVQSKMLKPGMKVVIKGNERLRDGQPVVVI